VHAQALAESEACWTEAGELKTDSCFSSALL